VRGIQSHDVDARVEQPAHGLGRRGRGSDRRHDLRAPHPPRLAQRARRARHTVDVVTDRIVINGIRARGVHGVLPEEQTRPQPFEVDIELIVDLAPAGASDALADTVDYGHICETVTTIVRTEHHQLLEHLAARIADACCGDALVQGVVVEVRKMEPPVQAEVAFVGVRIER
jgi:dihydroneopterin aldolase